MDCPILYIVIPCYNEQEVLKETATQMDAKLRTLIGMGAISDASRVLYVDDGSTDNTWAMIEHLHQTDAFATGLKLAHNRGHQNALMAGLMTAKEYADCVVSMDADLQDDIDVIDGFLEKYREGCDVVYGVRSKREEDSFFKRTSAQGFYKFMKLLGVETVYNHADCRLMTKRALDGLEEYGETNLFLRGIIPDMGFQSDVVYYQRHARAAGESKYPLRKMVSFAVDGITSFSVKPLTIISNVGLIISALSVLGLLYALISKLMGAAEAGWTAIVASIWLLGGIQLFCIGIVGTYIGKIFSEVKRRPRYLAEKTLIK